MSKISTVKKKKKKKSNQMWRRTRINACFRGGAIRRAWMTQEAWLTWMASDSRKRWRGFPDGGWISDERFCFRGGGLRWTWKTREVWRLRCKGGGVDECLHGGVDEHLHGGVGMVKGNSESMREERQIKGFVFYLLYDEKLMRCKFNC